MQYNIAEDLFHKKFSFTAATSSTDENNYHDCGAPVYEISNSNGGGTGLSAWIFLNENDEAEFYVSYTNN
jgi:hypothetical protein